ncbi:MAG: L-threonylcarbamoyladenylate synthase [Bacteroidales bacterium]
MIIQVFETGVQTKQIDHIIQCIRNGGIVIYPTDTVYGIGTGFSNRRALDRIAQLKGKRKDDLEFTLLCSDLSHLSTFCKPISNTVFRFIKEHTPGPFTFILEANNEVPKMFQRKKKQIGLRIPNHALLRQIIEVLGEPMLNTSIVDDPNSEYVTDPEYINEKYSKKVDLIIDGGIGLNAYSTIIDCTKEPFEILRQGLGIVEL